MHVILGIFILFLLGFGGVGLYRYFSRSDYQLVSKFKTLRKLLMKGMDRTHKKEAKKLLDRCGDYLDSMIRAQHKLELLEGMSEDVRDFTGHGVSIDRKSIQMQIREDMSKFFEELARISSVVDFDEDQSLDQLSQFTEDIEQKQEVILGLATGRMTEDEFMDELKKTPQEVEV